MIDFMDDKLLETAMDALERSRPRVIAKKAVKFTGIAAAAAAACFVIPLGLGRLGETAPVVTTDATSAAAALQAAEDYSDSKVPLPIEVVREMEPERALTALKSFTLDEIISAWGEPDTVLSDNSGGIWVSGGWETGGKCVLVFCVQGAVDSVIITDSEPYQYVRLPENIENIENAELTAWTDRVPPIFVDTAEPYFNIYSTGGDQDITFFHNGGTLSYDRDDGTAVIIDTDGIENIYKYDLDGDNVMELCFTTDAGGKREAYVFFVSYGELRKFDVSRAAAGNAGSAELFSQYDRIWVRAGEMTDGRIKGFETPLLPNYLSLVREVSPQPEKDSAISMIPPVKDGRIAGLSEESGGYAGHKGIDIVTDTGRGTPIYAAADGTVSFADYSSGYGYMAVIMHDGGYETLYGHCDKLLVSEGQQVKQGDTIAEMGASGMTTSYHLHFEVLRGGENVDPCKYVDIRKAVAEPPQEAIPGTDMILPVKDSGAVISAYYSSETTSGESHSGVDIMAKEGTPIYAAADGVVTLAQSENKAGVIEGIYLVIEHADGFETMYEHCARLYVSGGQQVKQGELIAELGSTGFSTGPHLHFEVKFNGVPVDPMNIVKELGDLPYADDVPDVPPETQAEPADDTAAEIRSLEDNLSYVTKMLEGSRSQISSLEDYISDTDNTLTAVREKIADLEQDLAELDKESDDYADKADELERARAYEKELSETLASLNDTLTEERRYEKGVADEVDEIEKMLYALRAEQAAG